MMTVIELKSKLSKGHARAVIFITIVFVALMYKYISALQDNQFERQQSAIDLALKSIIQNIAGRISVLAVASDFLDYIRISYVQEDIPLNLSSLAARLSNNDYAGFQVKNKESTVFTYGETTSNSIKADLCYRADVLDSKRGRCSHSIQVYFRTQQLLTILKSMNPNITLCTDCQPITQLPEINLTDLKLSGAVNLPVKLNIDFHDDYTYVYAFSIIYLILILLALSQSKHYRELLTKWIEKPLRHNKIDPGSICLDKLYMNPLWKHKSEMLELRASTESARDKQITTMIHDSIASPLSSIGFIVSALPLPEELKENAHSQIQEITRAAYKCMDTLYPEALEKHGLCKSLEMLVHRCINQEIIIQNTITDEEVDLATSMAAYMIVQESVSNSIKYANASEVRLYAKPYNLDQWILIFEDNGCGYDTDRIKKGRGTIHMNARAKGVGGLFTVISAPEKGTTIKVILPKKRKASDEQE